MRSISVSAIRYISLPASKPRKRSFRHYRIKSALIHKTANSGRYCEYYLWQNDYSNSLLAYRQALQLHGENAELYAALATVLYYQASQHMTAQTRAMIDKALALDSNEITALMLLASDAFMQANYAQAIELWQKVMDLNSPRINRTQLVESINMAKLLQRRSD